MNTASVSSALCAEGVWFPELVRGFNPFLEFSTNMLLLYRNIISGRGDAILFHSPLREPRTVLMFSCSPAAKLKVLDPVGGFPVSFYQIYFFEAIKATCCETYLIRLRRISEVKNII